MTAKTTTKHSVEDLDSRKLFNPNHFGPGPRGGQFAPSSAPDSGGSQGGGNPHRNPLTGQFSHSPEHLHSHMESAGRVLDRARDVYDTTDKAVVEAASHYGTPQWDAAAHGAAVQRWHEARGVLAAAQRRYYSLQVEQASRRFGEGKYQFIPSRLEDTEQVAAAMRDMFGRELTINELGDLAAANPGDQIHVSAKMFRGAWRMEVIAASGDWRQHGDISSGTHYTWRDIIKSGATGKVRIINQYNRDRTPDSRREPGMGTRRLARQVQAASQLGVSHLETHAAGNAFWASQGKKDGFNGYYTWARLGYNARIPGQYRAHLPSSLSGVSTIAGLMRTKEGRDWWKANGGDWVGKFSLKPGSYSRQTLDAYMRAHGYTLAEPAPVALRSSVHSDPRRISESDPDFQRVRSYWLRRLMASVRTLVADIRRGGPHAVGPAQSAFIHRHTLLLQQAYLAAHRQGQIDYWEAVSNTPRKWLRQRATQPATAQVQRRLLFYAAVSVTKMAREAEVAYNQSKRPHAGVKLADPRRELAFDQFAAWASPRVGLQVDITWSGFQDGYLDAASADMAGLRLQVWWELEPAAQHCDDCPAVAAGSPYDAPGSAGSGGNELDQTPGDGQTACGAACKCSLRYGYSDLAGAGLGAPGDNEVFLQPGETLPMVGNPPLPPAGPTPSDWEALHVQQLARGLGVEPPPLFGRGAPATPAAPVEDATASGEQQSPWEQWYREHIAPLMPAGYVDPIFDSAGIADVEAAGAEASPEMQAWAEAIKNSPFATPYDREIVESMLINGKAVRNIARVGPDLAPIEGLTEGQKGALDQMRGLALLWDAVRDELPAFEVYFDPDSPKNVWGNPNLDGLDETQRELVKRYFVALGKWEDATPVDEE